MKKIKPYEEPVEQLKRLVGEVIFLPEDMEQIAKEYPFEEEFVKRINDRDDKLKEDDFKAFGKEIPIVPMQGVSNYEHYLFEQAQKNLSFVADVLGSKQKARDFRDGKVTLADLGALSPVSTTKRLSDI